ncbi:benzoate/H(+) symporter BenE family transporter [Deinococcus sonorensis]|uniref:Benzoate/H(+) symporter BenE family transporter n=2 Tax=Deinococcus sonorensis TaxID=309891 RepID=A0AAU7U8A7_9DEIO
MTTPPISAPLSPWRQLLQDLSPSALLSGLVAVIVGIAGPTVLVYAVAASAHLPERAVLSWVWASTVICGLVTVLLSLRTRQPILSTWSTPGIAFLATALPGHSLPEAAGAFVVSGLLVVLLGTLPPLTRLMQRIPGPLAAALNAAILLPFGFHAVQALTRQPLLVGGMIAAYVGLRVLAPRWAVAGVLGAGIVLSAVLGLLHHVAIPLAPVHPQLLRPEFSLRGVLDLALPLTLLAFTGQVVPGMAVLQTLGYRPPAGLIVRTTGVASVAAAFVGCHSLTLGALLANIVAGPEAHPDPKRRYVAAVTAGTLNIVVGSFAGTFLAVMSVLPQDAITALAGLALLAAMASSLQAALQGPGGRLAAPTVLIVTLSGIAPLGIGAAFWGILAGLAVHALERPRAARPAPAPTVPVPDPNAR